MSRVCIADKALGSVVSSWDRVYIVCIVSIISYSDLTDIILVYHAVGFGSISCTINNVFTILSK